MIDPSELVQIGTVRLSDKTRCHRCGKSDPEMALQEGGLIYAYHWACIKRQLDAQRFSEAWATTPRPVMMGEQLGLFE